ncbi:uncharacterized protein LOC124818257 [Hydra vulgaris]|uniref:uncharacterized protein LOC124818257 n=1 Tax=Hydra vulgaris TaxID=6087 RepID=UPI0032EA3909
MENFSLVKPNNSNDLKNFADMMDIAVINLKELGKFEELADGSLYIKLMKKLPKTMLSVFLRWLFEKQKCPGVESLREWVIQETEEQAKFHHLCYCCLGNGHVGNKCEKSRKCGTDGCQEVHNRLLHLKKQTREKREETTLVTKFSSKNQIQEVAMRTLPVIITNGKLLIKVNALLDDASTQTYINSDVAAELGLQGVMKEIKINVLNGRVDTCRLGQRPIVDILIGLDNADLHSSKAEVKGRTRDLIARLTALGWTCVGALGRTQNHYTCHTRTLSKNISEVKKINETLKTFWEIENIYPTSETQAESVEDKKALDQAENSTNYVDGRYQIGIPWKEDPKLLPNNYEMAVNRLISTEKRLKRTPEVIEIYKETIQNYLTKGYIKKVSNNDYKNQWILPHFSVVKLEKETTKVRTVFDAAAKCQGVTLNDIIYQGPKLQLDLCAVLLRFQRNAVALLGDITEIVVFGVNSSPFQAQFVIQKHAEKYKKKFPLAAETVDKFTYMDDSMDSVETEEKAIELYNQLTQL